MVERQRPLERLLSAHVFPAVASICHSSFRRPAKHVHVVTSWPSSTELPGVRHSLFCALTIWVTVGV